MAWRAEVHHENILVLAGRLAGQSNRHFIKAALEVAVATLAGEYELEDADRSTLDHDTKGVAGAAEIVPSLSLIRLARAPAGSLRLAKGFSPAHKTVISTARL